MMPAPGIVTVFAKDPAAMQEAQQQMVTWARLRLQQRTAEHADLLENLEVAKKNKWRTATLKRAVSMAHKRMSYYEKVLAALEAGYYIVPNFPVGIFAIRTCHKHPTRSHRHHMHSYPHQVKDAESEHPPLGKGEYVDAQPTVGSVYGTNQKGEECTFWHADAFEAVAFPFTMVNPEIPKAISRAMALKIFDEVGCLPNRRQGQNRGDPLIIGRITVKNGYSERTLSFLLGWFMNLEDV